MMPRDTPISRNGCKFDVGCFPLTLANVLPIAPRVITKLELPCKIFTSDETFFFVDDQFFGVAEEFFGD